MNQITTLGSKIKKYRTRKGLSQLTLENEINASPGSISRIESGKINPSKETLLKLVPSLDLKPYKTADLYNMDPKEFTSIMDVSRKFMSSLTLDAMLQNSVNEIAYVLDLLGMLVDLKVDLKKEDRVFGHTFTQTWYTEIAMNVMPQAFNRISVGIEEAKDNYMVRAIFNHEVLLSKNLDNTAVPFVSPLVLKLLSKVSTAKYGIIFPIIASDNTSLGVICFEKSYKDDFHAEHDVLKSFTDHIATAIENTHEYEKVKSELEKLKNAKQ